MLREGIMKRALAAMMVLLAVSSCRTTRVTVARLATPTPTPVLARPAAVPPPTITPMPVVTAPSASRYDRTPGVLYEEKSSPLPTATVTPRPREAVPPTATPVRPTATARPPATAAVKEAAPAASSTSTPARPAATATRPVSTATPVAATATSVPPTETRVTPTATSTATSTPTRTVSARPTPTRKPGAYYEGEDVPFRLAVTWTPTVTPPVKHR